MATISSLKEYGDEKNPRSRFDPENGDTGSVVPITDIVYVDDLAVPNVAASPASHQHPLDTLQISLTELLGFVINWNRQD